ncbi:MAG: undecaprenyl-diphosphate phosphatase [Steroidobacteraceae bacterium]|nr:undecaprenyl-diphosphate phosphatase [Steroidobacteraceae bacterium]MDW8259345.1 undecaprenyl-diphosphate phosphatase [Gammaproteobacteria bacterium]
MEWWQAVILAIVQGLTEFLPISSSGHLVLAPHFLGWTDQGLAFDVAVHIGTLVAVLAYFRKEFVPLAVGLRRYLGGARDDAYGALALNLVVATIPVGLCGLLGAEYIENHLRSPFVVAFQLSVFGVLMWYVDRRFRRDRNEFEVGLLGALAIGIGQAISLVPGTSRSGITMTTAMLLGLSRESAARFAFLLAVPGIAAAGAYEGWKFAQGLTSSHVPLGEMLIGVSVSAVVGYACIHYFLRFIARIGFAPFMWYRLALAAVVLAVFWPR